MDISIAPTMAPLMAIPYLDWLLHLDEHLQQLATSLGPWLYVVLFLIVFCETGLVVTPFLPGDSLLFAVGALAAAPNSTLSIPWLIPLLIAAAVLGDAVNYFIGRYLGPKVFRQENSWLLNRKHLDKAQAFYEKYGSKTIVLARFVPIVRTFAPFVAGIGKMNVARFWFYNWIGGIVWVVGFLLLGYWFGNFEIVKKNHSAVVFGIIALSLLPIAIEFWVDRRNRVKAR
jgi:membrane-associated protein